jgi:hypothetical protein
VRRWAVVICALVLASCSDAQSPHAQRSNSAKTTSASPPAAHPGPVRQPHCRPASPINRSAGFPEISATGDQIQMRGLIMADGPDDPVHINEDVKIVWRITGSGGLHLLSLDPAGNRHPLEWGPTLHIGSNYHRPGDEWGAGYRFTRPGCWTLRAIRARGASADVYLKVGA